MRPIIQQDLDDAAIKGCQNPNCTGENHEDNTIFMLCPYCKDDGDLEISYKLLSSILIVSCHTCSHIIALVKVAQE